MSSGELARMFERTQNPSLRILFDFCERQNSNAPRRPYFRKADVRRLSSPVMMFPMQRIEAQKRGRCASWFSSIFPRLIIRNSMRPNSLERRAAMASSSASKRYERNQRASTETRS